METFQVEVDGEGESQCICCNNKSHTTHGFVYRNNDAYAVYYAAWSLAHPEKTVAFALAIGEWDNDSTSKDRVYFAIEARECKNEILFRVLSSEESAWSNTNLLGKMLDRDSALAHEYIHEAFATLEVVVRNHPAIKDYLNLRKPMIPVLMDL